jgi:hypothetical protein
MASISNTAPGATGVLRVRLIPASFTVKTGEAKVARMGNGKAVRVSTPWRVSPLLVAVILNCSSVGADTNGSKTSGFKVSGFSN